MSRSFYGRTGVDFRDTLSDGLSSLSPLIIEASRVAVVDGAEIIRNHAHDLANVSPREIGHAYDGRHMRDTIEIAVIDQPNGVSARIFIDLGNVPYAVHQEFGPNGKPFMRPAIDETREEVHQVMAQSIRDNMAGGFNLGTQVRFRRFA